jgi:peroxiredoxin
MPSVARIAALVASVTFVVASLPQAGLARRHPAADTGLRAVRYAKAPPDFAFADGTSRATLHAFVGRPVVLNFWASWCEPCRAELPAFVRLRTTYGDAVPLLTVSAEAPGVARAFLAEHGLDLPVVEDPEHAVFDAYTVVPIPVTIVIAPDGTVAHVSVGELDWDELHAAVAGLTPNPSPSPVASASAT